MSQGEVIEYLSSHPNSTATEISKGAKMHISDVYEAVRYLERKGRVVIDRTRGGAYKCKVRA